MYNSVLIIWISNLLCRYYFHLHFKNNSFQQHLIFFNISKTFSFFIEVTTEVRYLSFLLSFFLEIFYQTYVVVKNLYFPINLPTNYIIHKSVNGHFKYPIFLLPVAIAPFQDGNIYYIIKKVFSILWLYKKYTIAI